MVSTNKQKRSTKLIRIGKEWHRKLRYLAIEKSVVTSKLLDSIVEDFFSKNTNPLAVERIKKDKETILRVKRSEKRRKNIGKRM